MTCYDMVKLFHFFIRKITGSLQDIVLLFDKKIAI